MRSLPRPRRPSGCSRRLIGIDAVARKRLPPAVLAYVRKEGARGATLQAANMTPEQRTARATKASRAAALARTKKKSSRG
jgi:hypothetical protein